ncbi:MAG: response regulator [Desulfobulbaceae bacterium]|nr:response regulator [Desulfobulbaceae bacterium]
MKKLLIIDDGQLLCYGLRRALHQDQMQVDTVSSVKEAIRTLDSNSYDLCLVDIRFPDESGFETVKTIRDRWPDIKILLMTACDITLYENFTELIDIARSNGACHLLCKPFDLKQLREVISHALCEDGHDDWCEESFIINDARRSSTRKKWCKKFNFSMSEIKDGEVKRSIFPAESININSDGVVIITSCSLKPMQVISFDEALDQKSGVVVWSSLLEDNRYKAGVRFAY